MSYPPKDVIAFLKQPEIYEDGTSHVDVIETHGAMIFLGATNVYKIKKPVTFSYLDFSTLSLREQACRNEIKYNKPHAPLIYKEAIPITRESDGTLTINGAGTCVEWAVKMSRFDDRQILSSLARENKIDQEIIKDLSAAIAQYHKCAKKYQNYNFPKKLDAVIEGVEAALQKVPDLFLLQDVIDFIAQLKNQLQTVQEILTKRDQEGFVRHCHGDLHLNNIVKIEGRPVLFDAIEFRDDIAIIDTLYDLAFLLMDLLQCDLKQEANLLLNRYLYHTQNTADLEALTTLPFFIACRAAIRAMVAAQQYGQGEHYKKEKLASVAKQYFQAAQTYLKITPPQVVCVGGFSGTGKSTLAAQLAPRIGNVPGALHLRSDLERKVLLSVPETERLDPKYYTQEMSDKVYKSLYQKAKAALKAGHSVILDAVFSKEQERLQAETLAADLNIPFTGIWLTAPEHILRDRVAQRTGDASDATPEVVAMQIQRQTHSISWPCLTASGHQKETFKQALNILKNLEKS